MRNANAMRGHVPIDRPSPRHEIHEKVVARPDVDDQRAALARELRQRTGLDEAVLARLVRGFYARARVDPELGPIFAAHVADWPAHEARLVDFWASVALMAGRYHRNALSAHRPLALRDEHFERWLALFDATLREEFSASARDHLLTIATRIAATMRTRLCDARSDGLHPITDVTNAVGRA